MSLERLYQELCQRADELLAKHNPCNWDPIAKDCTRGTSGCCGGCPLLGETGCTIQSLACKLWVCPTVSETLPESVRGEFVRLWDRAQEANLLTFRGGARESVRNAKFPNAAKRRYALVDKFGVSTHIFLSDQEYSNEKYC